MGTEPIIVLYGPPACGKTMIVERLIRYLMKCGYNFRETTGLPANMLFQIFDGEGHVICSVCDESGESFFNPSHPTSSISPFVQRIINLPNKKIWVIIIDSSDRNVGFNEQRYVDNISGLVGGIHPKDKTVLLFSKVDRAFFLHPKFGLIDYMKDCYSGLFDLFRKHHPIIKWWCSYNCSFLPFSAGEWTIRDVFRVGEDTYPQRLWEEILSNL